VFAIFSHIVPSLAFSGKAGAYHSVATYETQLQWLAPSLAPKYGKETDNGKHSSLLRFGKNYCRKSFVVQALGVCPMTFSTTTLSMKTFSITTLSLIAHRCYAKSHLCRVSLMLRVGYKPILMSAIMLNVIMLNVIMLSVVAPLQVS
jgi:hypothetical protein